MMSSALRRLPLLFLIAPARGASCVGLHCLLRAGEHFWRGETEAGDPLALNLVFAGNSSAHGTLGGSNETAGPVEAAVQLSDDASELLLDRWPMGVWSCSWQWLRDTRH